MTPEKRVANRWMERKAPRHPDDGVIYVGVFLEPMAAQKLIRTLGQSHPERQAHHMTIWHFYDGGEHRLESLPLGRMVSLKVVGVAEDSRAQVAVVVPPSVLRPVGGRVPHVTVSVAPGTGPAYSNTLVEAGWKRLVGPEIRGRLGWWDGSQARFDLP